MKDFRLVAIDLDGTLLASDYTVSRRNRAAISKLVERGIRVTLCTGRMYASAAIYARELGLDTPLIAYQGALVKHAGTGEVIYERFVPLSLCRHLVLMARDYGLTINAYWQDELYVEKATPEAVTYARISQVPFREVG
ncbi:MAG: HAD-IIB family hydrolase, partial [Clostridia bacterium]|nr:HAD-IIB family hydrolase [Clostridia bacterium]